VTVLAFGDPNAIGPLGDLGVEVIAVPPPLRRPLATRFIDLFATTEPDLARRLASRDMDRAIGRLVDRVAIGAAGFDIVQVEGLEMALHGLAVHAALAARQAVQPRLIYDGHNAEWVLQSRARSADLRRPRGWPGALYSTVQTSKLRRFEARLLGAADAVVAVSAADAAALRDLAPGADLHIVPNGVDTDHYRPADPAGVEPSLCLFTGKMDFRPNIDAMAWFCGAVWPLVRARRPDACLAIVGRDPVPRVRALAGAGRGIEVTGAVADTRPWLARAGVVVVPLRVGGGTRLKVLEAMASAKAIAATTLGVEGLELTPGEDVDVGDTPVALADAIVRLMGDGARRHRLGAAARARAVARYRWQALVPLIEALYDRR